MAEQPKKRYYWALYMTVGGRPILNGYLHKQAITRADACKLINPPSKPAPDNPDRWYWAIDRDLRIYESMAVHFRTREERRAWIAARPEVRVKVSRRAGEMLSWRPE